MQNIYVQIHMQMSLQPTKGWTETCLTAMYILIIPFTCALTCKYDAFSNLVLPLYFFYSTQITVILGHWQIIYYPYFRFSMLVK